MGQCLSTQNYADQEPLNDQGPQQGMNQKQKRKFRFCWQDNRNMLDQNQNIKSDIENQLDQKVPDLYIENNVINELFIQYINRKAQPCLDQIYQLKNNFEEESFQEQKVLGKIKPKTDKSELSKLQVFLTYYQVDEQYYVYKLKYTFILPCSAETYCKYVPDIDFNKKADKQIDKMESTKLNDETSLIYIKYKKVLLADPRDFVYYQKVIEKDQGYVIANQSVQIPEYQENEKMVRGDIILTGNYIEDIEDGFCKIKTYSQVNVFTSIPPQLTKQSCINNIKSFSSAYYSFFQNLKSEQQTIQQS